MSNFQRKAFVCPIIIGLALIIVGLFIQMPGGALTTYPSLNGESTDYYEFDNRYSTIDEYVGGDAYNYIIGASLVAGKISGTMTVKAICIVAGVMCMCFGVTLMIQHWKNASTVGNKLAAGTYRQGTAGATQSQPIDTGKVDADEQKNDSSCL